MQRTHITVGELAKQSGMSRQWINKMVTRGRVPDVRRGPTGRLVIVETDQLKCWIAETHLLKTASRAPRRKRREFNRDIEGATLVLRVFGHDIKERFPNQYQVIEYAIYRSPLVEGRDLLRRNKLFLRYRKSALIEWALSAPTDKSFTLRSKIAQAIFCPDPSRFYTQSAIAKEAGVSRAAVSKALRDMPEAWKKNPIGP